MRTNLLLLRIEARRNLGLWFFPFIAVLIGYTATETLPEGVWLWPHTSVAIQATLVVVGPIAAGLSAWVAGRNRRRNIEELLATTPRPTAIRDLIAWTATAAWICLGYVVATILMLYLTYLGATWGSPTLGPLLAGFFALCMDSAVGYAVGYFLPRLFTAPLVAVLMYMVQGVVGFNLGSYLSPVATPFPDVFYGVFPDISAPQSLWFSGIAGTGLALVVLKTHKGENFPWLALIVAAAVAIAGAAILVRTPLTVTPIRDQETIVPYRPTCVEKGIPVCVHPAYEKMLPGVAVVVSKVTEPLVGIPGGPVRAEQTPDGSAILESDGTLEFFLYDERSGGDQLAFDLARALVQDEEQYRNNKDLTEVQAVVASWLMQPINDTDNLFVIPGENRQAVTDALERFAKLSSPDKRVWFRENYAQMRAGQLTSKDIP